MDQNDENEQKKVKERNHPLPNEFEAYLPWACHQLQTGEDVIITRTQKDEYSGACHKKESKIQIPNRTDTRSANLEENEESLIKHVDIDSAHVVRINTIYEGDDLVQIKFERNRRVPRNVLQIITLIVQFYPRLTTITINRGLDQESLYELGKILQMSKIHEVILDNTTVIQVNYYLLLDNTPFLNYLSLARCGLGDIGLEKLVSYLQTSNISVLNLCSNKITDVGARSLGQLLRTNRKLLYLNLAGNMITDVGADSILSSLMEFLMTMDEIHETKSKRFASLKATFDRTRNISQVDLCEENFVKKIDDKKKTSAKSPVPKKSRIVEDTNLDSALISLVKVEETFSMDGETYNYGNNVLSYLNLAYNNLSYLSIRKLYNVLHAQEELQRQPRGLVNVCIEGNNLPDFCMELEEIRNIIKNRLNVNVHVADTHVSKKKTGKKL